MYRRARGCRVAHQNEQSPDTQLDPRFFNELSAHWEARFFSDMERLNVLPPDTVTRVTDYIPEVVQYIETIIRNGYAYASGGDVYFDTRTFHNTPGHRYGKLVPWEDRTGEHTVSRNPTSAVISAIQIQVPNQRLARRSRNPTLLCGKHQSRESHHGNHPGAQVVLAGILSAQPWPRQCWGTRFPFTQVAST
jgi:tRNA synthetases class I (C) catalytic domain